MALPDLADCLDSFYDNGCVLPPVSAGIGGLPPDALLRELHDPPVEIRGRPLGDILQPAYLAMTEAARRRITQLDTSPSGR